MKWKNNKRKDLLSVVVAVMMVISCASTGSVSGDGVVSGVIQNGGVGSQLTLELLLPTEVRVVDSAIIGEDGSFSFNKVKVDEIAFYRVKQSDRNYITIIIEPEEQIVLESDWNLGIGHYEISGSEESLLLREINYQMSGMYRTQDSLQAILQGDPGNQELLRVLQDELAIKGAMNQERTRNFIQNHPDAFANLAAAEQLDRDNDVELYKFIDANLAKEFSNSVYYQEFHKVIVNLDNLAIGTEAPEIILPDANGKMVKLSSLRGKVVLIDFWASWCRPCRAENPNVVKAYNKYNDKGFEVFGVSLDQSKEKWLEAIEVDQLSWTQVSDLKFWSSSVVKLYDIKGIPFAVLIDQEGKIIAKNLRGPALDKKLEEILH